MRKTGREYTEGGDLIQEFRVFVLLLVGHTVRFESVRRNRDTSLTQKSVKSCYIGVLFRGGNHWSVFFSGRFGTQWRTPMDSLHQGIRGTKSGKRK